MPSWMSVNRSNSACTSCGTCIAASILMGGSAVRRSPTLFVGLRERGFFSLRLTLVRLVEPADKVVDRESVVSVRREGLEGAVGRRSSRRRVSMSASLAESASMEAVS